MIQDAYKQRIIRQVAQEVGTQPEWLDALIKFETAGTYDPKVKNPNSSARGLIQFIDSTAQSEFGMRDSLHLVNTYPTFKSQMENAVLPYLKKYAPLDTKQKLFMAVFYPAYMNTAPDTMFPERVRNANPGIDTPADYIAFVERRVRLMPDPKLVIPSILILGVGGTALWMLWKYNQRNDRK